ncbi:MAG: non-canonical purine NTP pyrophosphatase [Ruminococcaceae bacterium]|nr:non-canonical purine NTP pyrophosphatase [Oscillospiraceae bacterium]
MNNIVLASNNRKKIAEFETILGSLPSKYQVQSLKDIGYTAEIEEDGTSFEENSLIKAMVPAGLGYIGMADDSGLTVDALNGAPGIYSARYAGDHGDDKANRDLLLENLKDVPDEKRGGAFVCVITMVFPEDSDIVVPEAYRVSAELAAKRGVSAEKVLSVRGECRGVITRDERGEGGFGYDCLFYYPEFDGTFAEITQEQKNSVSHRGNAMDMLIEGLKRMSKV